MKTLKTIVLLLNCFIIFLVVIFSLIKTTHAGENQPVILNEVCSFSDPSCEDGEWIELYNQSDEDMILTGYTLGDLNIEKNFSLSEYKPDFLDNYSIPAKAYLLLKKIDSDFSFAINDTNEQIILRKDGEIISQLNYGTIGGVKQENINPSKGKSYAMENGQWQLTSTMTPGAINIITGEINLNSIPEIISIAEARKLENGETVSINGTVTTIPGTLSSQYFYIQDLSGGIQIYSFDKSFPTLSIGDVIKVTGELAETSGERRIKISELNQIVILNHTQPPPPLDIAASEIDEEVEGVYVKTSGVVTETSGDTFTISDGIKEIKVVIKKGTNIDKPKMKKGDQVEVIGIVSQYKDDYRILPIDQDDVKIVASKDLLPRAGSNEIVIFIISLFSTILWNMFLEVKKKPAT